MTGGGCVLHTTRYVNNESSVDVGQSSEESTRTELRRTAENTLLFFSTRGHLSSSMGTRPWYVLKKYPSRLFPPMSLRTPQSPKALAVGVRNKRKPRYFSPRLYSTRESGQKRSSVEWHSSIMLRLFVLLAVFAVHLIAKASSFMLAAPGLAATANVQHGAAVSGFTGYNSVEQRETVVDRSMLQMIVSRRYHT